jgi:hypothetical protein
MQIHVMHQNTAMQIEDADFMLKRCDAERGF